MSEETDNKLAQIQMVEQSMQNVLMQKQQVQSQLLEMESAHKEIENTTHAYKIIGNIMIMKDKKELQDDVSQKIEKLTIRLKSIEKQEEKAKEKLKTLQNDVMASMKDKRIIT